MDAISGEVSGQNSDLPKRATAASKPQRALLVDTRAVLGVDLCRTLNEMGWLVDVFALHGSPAFYSRACNRRLVCRGMDSGYLVNLASVIEAGCYQSIYICSEEILETLLHSGKSSYWPALPLSSPWALRTALSKNAMVRLAQRIGVPVPHTVFPSPQDMLMAANQIGFPLVVKGDRGEAARNVRFAKDAINLLSSYQEVVQSRREQDGPPALQEFIPGTVYSVAGLFQDGRPLRVYAYRKLFSYPPSGGLTAKTITDRPAELLDAAFAVFAELRYTGLGQMQFIRDGRDGRFKFLEINPRIWGCIGLARYAGVDLHTAYASLAAGSRVLPDLKYKVGVIYHRFSVEMRLIIKQPRHLPRFVRDCLDPRVYSDFSWRDPWPHLPSRFALKKLLGREYRDHMFDGDCGASSNARSRKYDSMPVVRKIRRWPENMA